MFDFLGMIGNYESRKVDSYEDENVYVSTARVTDSTQPSIFTIIKGTLL